MPGVFYIADWLLLSGRLPGCDLHDLTHGYPISSVLFMTNE